MKTISKSIVGMALAFLCTLTTAAQTVRTDNINIRVNDSILIVSADIVLDSLKLGSNKQVFITPVVESTDSLATGESAGTITLPSVLVNGRNMHISYERGVLRNFKEIKSHDIVMETQRRNGKKQTIPYLAQTRLDDFMSSHGLRVSFVVDECGCGTAFGRKISEEVDLVLFENPAKEMNSIMIIPEIEQVPVQIHEGRARIQFEVDRTALHVMPYVCRNGQRIDNREQLKVIDDSVKYALTDPNVEISAIELCGYASPESPYLHNVELADGRSKILAEYVAERYNLPAGSVSYSSVPENWGEFREMVVTSGELTEHQRELLLDLIDEPAETPEQYDRKEWLLKSDPRYSSLYRSKILPEWFPKLRATTFAIHTRLKDLSDDQLKEVIKTTPEKMSLNQMYRVALLYPEDSDEFNDVMLTALKYYPRDQVAITNAATAAVAREEYERAKQLLSKVPDNTPAVYNLLGIIATAEEKYDVAKRYFEKAAGDASAERNIEMLK